MFQEAFENWYSLSLLDWPGFGDEVGLTAEAWCTQTCHLAPELPLGAPASANAGRRGRTIALLSLFDGLGTARLAVQDALEELGCADALRFAGYAELYPGLASTVEAYWTAGSRLRAGGRATGLRLMCGTSCGRMEGASSDCVSSCLGKR